MVGIQYAPAAQCIIDSVETFRANNSELPDNVTPDLIRFAVIRAFAKADIMTETETELVALFDYQRSFEDIVLFNRTSLPDSSEATFDWDLNDNGTADMQTSDLDTPVIVTVDGSDSSVDIKLSAQQNGQLSSYLRTIDLAPIYCTPSGDGKNQHYIKQIALNNAPYAESESETGGYGDYTTLTPAMLDLSGKNIFTLTPNNDSVERYWAVYIDLNGDHDFTDDGEKVIDKVSDYGKTPGVLNEVVELDLGAEHAGKLARMRVVLNWSVNVRPCGSATSGEHEDYLVLLGDIPNPSPSFNFVTTDDSLSVNFTNTSELGAANATWSWRYKYPANSSFTEFSTQEHPEFSFPESGAVTIELVLITSIGDEYLFQQSINIPPLNDEPLLGFDIEVTEGSRDVLFVNQTTHYANDVTWHWDYGDGETTSFNSFIERHTHKYDTDEISDDVDALTITLSVTQNSGLINIKRPSREINCQTLVCLFWEFHYSYGCFWYE